VQVPPKPWFCFSLSRRFVSESKLEKDARRVPAPSIVGPFGWLTGSETP